MARVEVTPTHFTVDGRSFGRTGVTRVYAKAPKIVEQAAGHNPRPPRGLFSGLGFAVGKLVYDSQLARANREEWEIWANQQGRPIMLAKGFSQQDAEALAEYVHSLVVAR